LRTEDIEIPYCETTSHIAFAPTSNVTRLGSLSEVSIVGHWKKIHAFVGAETSGIACEAIRNVHVRSGGPANLVRSWFVPINNVELTRAGPDSEGLWAAADFEFADGPARAESSVKLMLQEKKLSGG
jgi:hypothetical protein